MWNLENGTDEPICKAEIDIDTENKHRHQGEKGRCDELGDWDWHKYTAMHKTEWEPAVQHRELCSVLCGDLMERTFRKRRVYVNT